MEHKARKTIDDAEVILITAGAGMGVDSGLPDFRGNDGFWKAYPVIQKLGISFEEMANPMWFHKKPSLAWAFYGHRLNLYRNTTPHKGFEILQEIVKGKEYFIYTSNVDGHFQKSGFDAQKIYECHGSIHYLQCSCDRGVFSGSKLKIKNNNEKFEADYIPICKECGKTLRPNIMMFFDTEFNPSRIKKQENRLLKFLKKNREKKIVIIEIGAGKVVSSVRDFSDSIAKYENATLIRINPRDSDGADIQMPFNALVGIEKLLSTS